MNVLITKIPHSKRYINLQNIMKNKKNNFDSNYNSIIKNKKKKYYYKNLIKKIMIIGGISGLCTYYYFYKYPYFENKTENINLKAKMYINSLLVSEELKEGGVVLLDRIFKDDKSKDATIELIQTVLENKTILDETSLYAVSLLNNILSDNDFKTEIRNLIIEIIKSDEVKEETVNVLRFFVEKKDSQDIVSQFFKLIFLREDIMKALASVISDSAVYSMADAATKKKFAEFITDVWSDPNLRWFVLKKSLNFWEPATISITTNLPEDTKNNPTKSNAVNVDITPEELLKKLNELKKNITNSDDINKTKNK